MVLCFSFYQTFLDFQVRYKVAFLGDFQKICTIFGITGKKALTTWISNNKWLFATINWNIQNSMNMCTFSVLDKKYPLWANLFQKIKIVSLSWNLIPWLIWISRIQWWCSLFSFSIVIFLSGQIWSKKSKLLVSF